MFLDISFYASNRPAPTFTYIVPILYYLMPTTEQIFAQLLNLLKKLLKFAHAYPNYLEYTVNSFMQENLFGSLLNKKLILSSKPSKFKAITLL